MISSHTPTLTEGVLKAMSLTKLKTVVTVGLLAVSLTVLGSPVLTAPMTAAQRAKDENRGDEIDRLIHQLGSDKCSEREVATKRLDAIGPGAHELGVDGEKRLFFSMKLASLPYP